MLYKFDNRQACCEMSLRNEGIHAKSIYGINNI